MHTDWINAGFPRPRSHRDALKPAKPGNEPEGLHDPCHTPQVLQSDLRQDLQPVLEDGALVLVEGMRKLGRRLRHGHDSGRHLRTPRPSRG